MKRSAALLVMSCCLAAIGCHVDETMGGRADTDAGAICSVGMIETCACTCDGWECVY